MLLKMFILMKQGEVAGIFDVIPMENPRAEDAQDLLDESIKASLRRDREEFLYGPGVPDKNPSLDPSTVGYYYTPSLYRQRLYAQGFPIQLDTHKIIDAFVCAGSRFGLEALQVYVELCRSDMGGHQYWVNIYYVSDSQVPACVIRVEERVIELDTNQVVQNIDRERREDEEHRAFIRQLDEERYLEADTYLTAEMLAPFFGGQLMYWNRQDGTCVCGHISDAIVVNDQLIVTFSWAARQDTESKQWIQHDLNELEVDLIPFRVHETKDQRLRLIHPDGHLYVFSLPTMGEVDPSKIEGLMLTV